MKGLWICTAICFVLVLGSLFLPYTLHDAFGEKDIQTIGLELWAALLPLPVIILIALIVLIGRNLATGILGFILAFFLLAYMSVLAYDLTPTFSRTFGLQNYRLSIGFYLAAFAIISHCGMRLFNLIIAARDPKAKFDALENSELLDDSF